MAARQPMMLAGLEFAKEAFRQLDARVQFESELQDGAQVPAGAALIKISGHTQALLTAERVALNFTQRLSGIATATRQYVAAIEGTRAKILDTRKTTPGWRSFEKYAVACGGARNHRFGLYDLILIKDNHLAALRDEKPNAIAAAVARARKRFPELKVEVEADTLEQVAQALDAGADILLLDNMSLEQLRSAVRLTNGRALLEASGGVKLHSVRAIAETGVDFISVGAITHSAPAADIGLDFL
jgi:nicotinate-nucleotide pyrophosphorylase (carboxylating)